MKEVITSSCSSTIPEIKNAKAAKSPPTIIRSNGLLSRWILKWKNWFDLWKLLIKKWNFTWTKWDKLSNQKLESIWELMQHLSFAFGLAWWCSFPAGHSFLWLERSTCFPEKFKESFVQLAGVPMAYAPSSVWPLISNLKQSIMSCEIKI